MPDCCRQIAAIIGPQLSLPTLPEKGCDGTVPPAPEIKSSQYGDDNRPTIIIDNS